MTTNNSLGGLHLIAAAALIELGENHSAALSSCRPNIAIEATLSTKKSEPSISPANMKVAKPSKERKKFPMQLHALLADPSVHDGIFWLPHGRSFVVIRPEVLAARVLPAYFAPEGSVKAAKHKDGAIGKYPSFKRKLNRWGFRQVTRGADRGAFYHKLFLRDDPDASRGMVCQKSMKSDSKSVSLASAMSSASSVKRSSSGEVTVSTNEESVARSLPLKKRRLMDVPSSVEMKTRFTKKKAFKSTSALSTVSLEESSPTTAAANVTIAKEEAKKILARNLHEEQRAHVLALLMENSRRAMLASDVEAGSTAGARSPKSLPSLLQNQSGVVIQPSSYHQLREGLGAKTNSAVFAPIAVDAKAQQMAAAEVAKNALFEAYKKAVLSF